MVKSLRELESEGIDAEVVKNSIRLILQDCSFHKHSDIHLKPNTKDFCSKRLRQKGIAVMRIEDFIFEFV